MASRRVVIEFLGSDKSASKAANGVAQQTTAASAALTKAGAASKAASTALAKSSSDVTRLTKTVSSAADAQANAASRLRVTQAKLAEVQGNSKAKASQLASAEEAVAVAQRKVTSTTNAAQNASISLAKAQYSAKTAAESLAKAHVHAKTATDDMGKSEEKVAEKSSKLGALGRGAMLAVAGGAVAAGAGLVKLGTDSVNLEADFSRTMNTMGAVANVPKDQMKGLSDLALKMGADTTFSASEAATAMLELAKGGLSSATIQGGALAGTLTLAAAGGTDLETAATIASNALNTFGLKGKDMASVAAALAGGANASTASVESLGNALSQVGPGAKTAGLSLQETVGVLASFDSAGIKGNDAGTSLKTMLTRLVPQTKKAAGEMNDLGLKFTDAKGAFVPITNVAEQLKTKLGGLSAEQRTTALATMFGSDATRAATVLMNLGSKGLSTYIKATNDQSAAQTVAKARMAGTAGALESFKGSVETAKLQLGLFLAPAVQGALKLLTGGLNNLVPGIKKIVSVLTGNLNPAMGGSSAKFKEIASFIGEKVFPRVKELAEFIVKTVGPVLQKILKGALEGATKAFDRVKKALEDNRPQLEKFVSAIGVVVKWVAEKLGPILGWLAKTAFRLVGERIVLTITAISKFVDAIGWSIKKGKEFGTFMSGLWTGVRNVTSTVLTKVWEIISGFFGNLLQGAAKAFGWVPGLGGKLKTAATEFGKFKDNVNASLGKIKDQSVTIKPVFDKNTMSLASAGRRADGGPGGPVSGPGTGTSDTAGLYALSNGEHVLTAEEVKKAGGHGAIYRMRQSIRSGGLGGFAGGGSPGLKVNPAIPGEGPINAFSVGVAAGARAVAQPFAQALAGKLMSSGPGGPPGSVSSFRGEKLNTRTIGMLLAAEKILGHVFNIMQGSYSTRVAASGGTHAGGGVMDTDGPGGWSNAQSALRKVGFAAWHRTPAQGPWGHHIHSVAIGDNTASAGAKRQVQDYLRGGDGLGSYQNGTPYVPETGLYKLHKGEAVTPERLNRFAGGRDWAALARQAHLQRLLQGAEHRRELLARQHARQPATRASSTSTASVSASASTADLGTFAVDLKLNGKTIQTLLLELKRRNGGIALGIA